MTRGLGWLEGGVLSGLFNDTYSTRRTTLKDIGRTVMFNWASEASPT